MAAPSSPDAIGDGNTRYHDGAAADYDAKWGSDWGQIGREQVLGKLRKALGGSLPVFDRSLEVGAGTGLLAADLLLELAHLHRHRRRRQVQRLGGTREAEVPGDSDEHLQLPQGHVQHKQCLIKRSVSLTLP